MTFWSAVGTRQDITVLFLLVFSCAMEMDRNRFDLREEKQKIQKYWGIERER
jgi:hypothetical protein